MKRIILFTLIFSAGIFTVNAQEVSAAFKAGLNMSRFSGPVETGKNIRFPQVFTLQAV